VKAYARFIAALTAAERSRLRYLMRWSDGMVSHVRKYVTLRPETAHRLLSAMRVLRKQNPSLPPVKLGELSNTCNGCPYYRSRKDS
jgi:hypothetical protein